MKLWKQSAALEPGFAIVHRNLALAYTHQKPDRDLPAAIKELQLAVAASRQVRRGSTELDELRIRKRGSRLSSAWPCSSRIMRWSRTRRRVVQRDWTEGLRRGL